MDQTQKLLQSVVENARTGLDACEQLLKHTKDADMRDELMNERDQYQQFAHDAERALYAAGSRPHAKPAMERMGMWVGLQINTLKNASTAHIADITIQGATMGIIAMTRDRNDLSDASPDAQGLASRFITAQQEAIERLKAKLTLQPTAN